MVDANNNGVEFLTSKPAAQYNQLYALYFTWNKCCKLEVKCSVKFFLLHRNPRDKSFISQYYVLLSLKQGTHLNQQNKYLALVFFSENLCDM